VIPDQYVKATEGGRMSVVFETYPVGAETFRAWILWLSQDPIPVIKLKSSDVQLIGAAPTRDNAVIVSFTNSQYGSGTHLSLDKTSTDAPVGGTLNGVQLEYGTFNGLEINARLRYLTSGSFVVGSVLSSGLGGGFSTPDHIGLNDLGGEFDIGYDFEFERVAKFPEDFHLGAGLTLGAGGGMYQITGEDNPEGDVWFPIRLNVTGRYSMVVAQLTLAEEAHLAALMNGGGWPLVIEAGLGVAF
jgi:hypothetical protein